MSPSISFDWSGCHVVARGGGWSRLAGVPQAFTAKAASRLEWHGAKSVQVIAPGVVQFKAGAGLCTYLVQVFPCCPLP